MPLRHIIQTLLFVEIFVSTVIWDFCTAFLAPCTSKSVCLPFLQPFLFSLKYIYYIWFNMQKPYKIMFFDCVIDIHIFVYCL